MMVGENMNMRKLNTETCIDDSKNIGPELKDKRTKYVFVCRHQTTGQKHYVDVANKNFENVARFKYLGTALVGHSCIYKEIKSRLDSGNGRHRAVRIFFSAIKNVLIEWYKPLIFLGVIPGLSR